MIPSQADMTPTHATIDGFDHPIAKIEPASPGSAHTHRVRFECGILFDLRGEHEFADLRWRWLTPSDKQKPCPACIAIASGKATAPEKFASAGESVRLADIPLGIACPACGGEIRVRRYGAGAGCAQGHDYTIPEVEQVAAALLTRLAGGHLIPTKKED